MSIYYFGILEKVYQGKHELLKQYLEAAFGNDLNRVDKKEVLKHMFSYWKTIEYLIKMEGN